MIGTCFDCKQERNLLSPCGSCKHYDECIAEHKDKDELCEDCAAKHVKDMNMTVGIRDLLVEIGIPKPLAFALAIDIMESLLALGVK